MAACGGGSTSASPGAATTTTPASPGATQTTGSGPGTTQSTAGSSTADKPDDGTTITVWTMEDSKKFTDLMQNFTQRTGITVKVEAIPWANVGAKLTTAVASGNGPDVVQVGLSNLPDFVSAGALLDLSPYLKDHPALQDDKFLPGVASDKTSPAGKVLSIPWISDVRVLFYRSDILQQAGITTPPATWTDLFNDAKKLAQRGNRQYGYYIPQWDQALPIEFTWQAGGDVLDPTGKVTFDTPAFKQAADFYLSFYRNKLVPTASDSDQTQGFISGASPLLISGPYLESTITGSAPQLNGKWNVAPLPKDKTGTSLLGGSNMGIWSKSQHVQADLKLLDYLSGTSAQLAWFKAADEMPSTKAALADPTLNSDPMVKVYVQQLSDAKLLPLVPNWGKINQDALDALNKIALQGADEQSTLAQLNQIVAALQK
ncbi:MAG: extracellular solute-binding protein [Actinobacteria bacterium]|nr:extracellular solute-binding protein [Actinomycetota bacterium]